jgi:SAM-dependent methyltransferase
MGKSTFKNWVSSTNPSNESILIKLEGRMKNYYQSIEKRAKYNELIKLKEDDAPMDPITQGFITWLQGRIFTEILEIGCGNGRIYHEIEGKLRNANYTGIEVDKFTIERNANRWPDKKWICSGIYDIALPEKSFDLIYSFYVLEHLVFPEKALRKMHSLLRPGGSLVLVFPDFTSTQRLPSQQLGWGRERTAMEKLKKGKLLDALISLYQSRISLKNGLQWLQKNCGNFYINTTPVCLDAGMSDVWPDIDAVYIANKGEVEHWAINMEMKVEFPYGWQGNFQHHAFMVLTKLQ